MMNRNRSPFEPAGQRIALLFFIAALGVYVVGCAGPGPRPPGRLPHYPSPEAAMRALSASVPAGPLQALTATARIEISRDGERFPAKIAVMIKRPDLLRIESIPLFGPPDFFLSLVADELRVYLPGRNEFYIGRPLPQNISRFFPLFLPVAEIIPLLLGIAPEDRQAEPPLVGEDDGPHYRIDRHTTDHHRQSLWIDPADDRLIRIRTFAEGERLRYDAVFSERLQIGEQTIPQRLTISSEGAASLALRYTDIRSVEAGPENFQLALPEGITPIPLDP